MTISCNLFLRSGTILSKTPLGKGLACSRDLYLTTQNIHKKQTTMLPARFEQAAVYLLLRRRGQLDQRSYSRNYSKRASWLTGVSIAWESKGSYQGESFGPAQANLKVAI